MRREVKVGPAQVVCECFIEPDHGDIVVQVDDRFYRVRKDKDAYYVMVRVGRHTRTIRGGAEQLLRTVCQTHTIYRDYEKACREAKQQAQLERDKQLTLLVEASGSQEIPGRS